MTAEFAPLRTERLTLRLLQPEDAPDLHRLINDWDVVRWLSRVPFPYPRELADEWIASTHRQLAEGAAWHLAIVGQDGDAEVLVGCVGLTRQPETRRAELGYWVGRRFWGFGVAAEAAGRLARWGLAHLDLDRIFAHVLEENARSAAVLRRIGLVESGRGEAQFLARGAKLPVLLFEGGREDLTAPVPVPDPPALAEPPPGAKPMLLVAACALVDSDGRVLLARRPEGKPMAGLWEFPGGKLDPGETPEAALIRELKEELGIDVSAACLAPFTFASHDAGRFHLLMPLYLCRRWEGTVTAREGQALAWVRPGKLSDYAMPPADKPLVALLRDFL
ncbi:bifunctional GNAT family N-acetyltransferase/(deoxy)nucleoside triphosphate pyrophosphohydrolase [Roseomonas sp. E05]|uniref:bifunctional GNAT family N-acetyltransferase/(deoxy)nucleoside triphosphate pyrophosphohydrolase n=1 Tax=Roseomonas sp. E05 TaxID=3046310 RepID=UPI0024BB43DE|nr:bifunctional GNAT family N-acetyltransferase/(deoxy)nucleoside triphosphate pyrophosphohydrolase [Roseomonas sp. E05]MDJ0386602.1 bifunctional GNAT family N-acetyltransferase/(deoxy)nucleoside triphosphate pyrophosphohydrolase [Roseomonas sp. E05]